MRHLPGTAASKGPTTQRRCQLLRVSLPSKFWSKSGPKPPTVRAKVRIREQSRVRFSPKTNVSWRPHPQANPRSLMKEVLSCPVLALHHGSAGSDFAPPQEPCPVAGAGDVGMAEASEHPARPSCSQGGGAPELHGWQQSGVPKSLLKAMPKTTRIGMVSQRSLWNFTPMASQRPGQSSLYLPRHGVQDF